MENVAVTKVCYRVGRRTKEMLLLHNTIVRPVVGYEDLYSVTNWGDLISHHRARPFLIRPGTGKDGYVRAVLHKRGKRRTVYLHRLIAEAFLPNPQGKPQVNHINGRKAENHVANLEWCTIAENIQHGHATGLIPHGEKHYLSKLSQEDVTNIRAAAATGILQKDLAKQYGVTPMAISSLMTGKTWKHTNSIPPCRMT